ncbi:CRISPR-associated endonuclease Cas2 [bacterium]|nr:CRISPR-associated endonuclease Cas2 [bacterium]
MLVISYDISDDKLRCRFAKMLTRNGAIRLQYSVYEVNNSKRVMDNIVLKIEDEYSRKFGGGDSVIIFDVSAVKLKKYGNAIHRDQDIVYL